jgi:cob(I)alamin adenosyltransferase
VTIKRMGEGFTWETQDRQRDIDAAQQAWDAAKDMIRSGDFRLILCDELNIVLRYDYLDINEVVDFLQE